MYITKTVDVDVDIDVDDLLDDISDKERAELLQKLGAGEQPQSIEDQLRTLRMHANHGDADRFFDAIETLARSLDFPFLDCSRLRVLTKAAA